MVSIGTTNDVDVGTSVTVETKLGATNVVDDDDDDEVVVEEDGSMSATTVAVIGNDCVGCERPDCGMFTIDDRMERPDKL